MRSVFLALFSACASGTEVTTKSFDSVTAGKRVFVKFAKPGCSACEDMERDWELLRDHFKEYSPLIVAEVDCSNPDSQTLCEEEGVKNFPTLKYGDADNLREYTKGTSHQELIALADDNLGSVCGPAETDLCDDDQKADIEKFEAMTGKELNAYIKENKASLKNKKDGLADVLRGVKNAGQYAGNVGAMQQSGIQTAMEIKKIADALRSAKAVKAMRIAAKIERERAAREKDEF
jgi:protein disulfide-isomerase A6